MQQQYQVLVENQLNGLFAAAVVGLPDCRAEAESAEAALRQVKTALETRLAHSQLYTIEVNSPTSNPWLELYGSLRDDPTFDDWQQEIANYRREVDAANQVQPTAQA